ncbi:MAG: DUF262 domain-containing protein [Elusimicrobiota bacterium]
MGTISMTRTLYRVSDFISWQKAGSLELSPSFQRRPIWPPAAKSYLIDTVARGLPIPIIFLRERKSDPRTLEPRREVVDGQQRLRTLISFISPKSLPDFKKERDTFVVKKNHNAELAKRSFKELSDDVRSALLDYQFSVHVLPAHVDDREVLAIFARMNATGVKLNKQELRNAGWFGSFKTCMYDLAYQFLPQWRNWHVFSENDIARMHEVELASEFAQLMLKGVVGKTQGKLNKLYDDFEEKFADRKEVVRRFQIVMQHIDDGFGEEMRVLPFRKKALVYPLFALIYDVAFGLGSSLKRKKERPVKKALFTKIKAAGDKLDKQTASEKVLEAVARRTTHISSRKIQLGYLKKECGLA